MQLSLNNRYVNTINGSLVADNLTASTFLKCDADKKIVTYGTTLAPADLTNYPSDGSKYLAGDGTWKVVSTTGTADYVAIFDNAGALTQEQYLSNVRGGLGADFVGVGNADEVLLVNGAGDAYASAKLADANVASNAAVARSKLAADSNHNTLVLNDNSGVVSSDTKLGYVASTGALTLDVTTLNLNAPTTVSLGSTASVSLGNVVKFGASDVFCKTYAVATTDATATLLADFAPANSSSYYIKYTIVGRSSTSNKSLVVKANAKVNCDGSGAVTFNNPPAELFSNVDTELASCVVALASAAANSLTLKVTGLVDNNISWICKAKVMKP